MLIFRVLNKIVSFYYKIKLEIKSQFRCGFLLNLKGHGYIKIGSNVRLGNYGTLHALDRYKKQVFNPSIRIKDNVSIGDGFHISIVNDLFIDEGTLMGYNVTIIDNSHGKTEDIFLSHTMDPASRKLHSKGGVHIGKNVWIGDKVTILPNVKIGDDCIIGSNSVVSKSFNSKNIIAGIPARIIKSKKKI